MAKRHKDALDIQSAVNPSGIALALHEAFKEVIREGGDTDAQKSDPACKLMLYQLTYLLGISGGYDLVDYGNDLRFCQGQANPPVWPQEVDPPRDLYEGFDVPAEAIEMDDPDTNEGYAL